MKVEHQVGWVNLEELRKGDAFVFSDVQHVLCLVIDYPPSISEEGNVAYIVLETGAFEGIVGDVAVIPRPDAVIYPMGYIPKK